jgi:hypothetical protein
LAKFHTKNNIAKEALAAKKLSGIYLFFWRGIILEF